MQILSIIQATKLQQIGIGRGMNSQVFLCHDPQLGGNIVIKEIPLTSFPSPQDYFREAQKLYANKHPRVVPVLYACQDATNVRIAMPFFSRGSLHDEIDRRVLTTREIVRWGQEFLSGLHFIHANNYIHFDVKPSNILFHDDGSAMLADFGQARVTNNLGVGAIPPMYPAHITPEFCISTGATKQSDIYQSGLTLYRMCNGNALFDSQRPSNNQDLLAKTASGLFPNRQKFLPHVPLRLRKVIRTALNVNPADRYQTAEDLMLALGSVNQNLDWNFSTAGDDWHWERRNFTHSYHVQLNKVSNKWVVEGFSVRLDTGVRRKKSEWCRGSFANRGKAEQEVERLFRAMG